MAWSREEVEATVADYFQMLTLELAGQSYNKSIHRRNLIRLLDERSEAAVELKHQNISAILIEFGCPYISGYKPRRNYQKLLLEIIADRLQRVTKFDGAASAAVELPAANPSIGDFSDVTVAPPTLTNIARDSAQAIYRRSITSGVVRDYLAREARNQALGKAGEEFAVEFERWRLIKIGKPKLADRVEHVSLTKGDGLGFDILSFEASGCERFIEVKTTSFGRETPFFVTKTELALSKAEADQFCLYRLFEFRKAPKLFTLAGAVDTHCLLDPVSYRARFS